MFEVALEDLQVPESLLLQKKKKELTKGRQLEGKS